MPPRNKSALILRPKAQTGLRSDDEADVQPMFGKVGKPHRDKIGEDHVEKRYNQLKSNVDKILVTAHNGYRATYENQNDRITSTWHTVHDKITGIAQNQLPSIENSLTAKTNNLKSLRKRNRDIDNLTKVMQQVKDNHHKLNEFGSTQIDALKQDVRKLSRFNLCDLILLL
jgi:hypothetical protein